MTGSILFALTLLAASPLEVTSAHEQIDVDGQRFWWVRPGVPLTVSVDYEQDEKLEVDFVRFGAPGTLTDPSVVVVERDGDARKIKIRVPLEEDRRPTGHDDLRASYPVRYRFEIQRPKSVFKLRVSPESAPQGIGVTLTRRKPPEDALALVPLPSSGRPVGQPPPPLSPLPPEAVTSPPPAVTSPPPPVEPPPPVPPVKKPPPAKPKPPPPPPPPEEPVPEPEPEPEEEQPEEPAPAPAPPAIEIAAPPPEPAPLEVTEEIPPPVPEQPPTSTYGEEDTGLGVGLPMSFNLQLSPGIGVQPVGGLSAWPASVGVRAIAYYRHGDSIWNRFGIGLSGAVGYETAQDDGSNRAARVSWSALSTRLRLELATEVYRFPVGANSAFINIFGGAGVLLGNHWWLVNGVPSSSFMFGPTGRLGVEAGIKLGPGAITAAIPVDASWDFTSKVKGYAPLAASLYVGYRLDL